MYSIPNVKRAILFNMYFYTFKYNILLYIHCFLFSFMHMADVFTTWLCVKYFFSKQNALTCMKTTENPLTAAVVVIELAASSETDNYSKVGKSGRTTSVSSAW